MEEIKTFCVNCGINAKIDGGGDCIRCGADAWGHGVAEIDDLRARLEKAEARLDRYEKIKTEAIKLVRLIESAGFCSIQIDMLRMAIGDAEEANREEG